MSSAQSIHVRMLYDFEYTVPSKPSSTVSLKAGERFSVVNKLSDNWWIASRLNQPDIEIVIPAKYVEEIRLPVVPIKVAPSSVTSVNSVVLGNSVRSIVPSETLLRNGDGPPKVPAKPGKKPETTSPTSQPELEKSELTELYEILIERLPESISPELGNKTPPKVKNIGNKTQLNNLKTDEVVSEGNLGAKISSPKKVASPNRIVKKKQLHNMSLDDLPKVSRRISDGNEDSAENNLSYKSMTLERLGGAFSEFWSNDRDIFHKIGSPLSEKGGGVGSISSLDIDFVDDDDAFTSSDQHLQSGKHATHVIKPTASQKRAATAPPDVPLPPDGASPLKTFDNGYEMYHDELLGRNYYYNRQRGESTWVLPRRGVQLTKPDVQQTNGEIHLPPDWTEEKDENGEPEFVHKITKARFKSKLDDLQRLYYYNTDTVTSYWYLPLEEEIIADIRLHIENNTFSEKSGYLQKAKISEFGKKIKKSWSSSYVVLCRAMVYFYKDQKPSKHPSKLPTGKPEAELDLRGASVDIGTTSRSSRKNVIQVKSATGTEFLLHSEEENVIQDWYSALQNNLTVVGREALENPATGAATLLRATLGSNSRPSGGSTGGGSGEINNSLQSLDSSDDHSLSIGDQGATHSPPIEKKDGTLSNKGKKDLASAENKFHRSLRLSKRDRSRTPDPASVISSAVDGGPSSTDKVRSGKDKLKFWLSGRPSKDALRAKGIYKECEIFGSHLLTICQREHTKVPRFIEDCIAAVEKGGLTVDGIYRLSGNMSDIQKLRCSVNQGEAYNLLDPDLDIHVVTGALKLFLRELIEPVIPFRFFQRFIDAYTLPDRGLRVANVRELVGLMPVENRETIRELFRHLIKVMEHSKSNRMSVQNLAIVFGPTLMWPEECETPNLAVSMVQRGQLVEFLLLEYQNIY